MWWVLCRQAVFLIERDWAKQKLPTFKPSLESTEDFRNKGKHCKHSISFFADQWQEKSHLKECCCPGVRVMGILMSVWFFSLTDLLCAAVFMSVAFLTVPSRARSGLNCPPNVSSFIPYNIFPPIIITQMFLCNLTSNHNSETVRANFCYGNMSVSLMERKLSFPYLVIDLILKASRI